MGKRPRSELSDNMEGKVCIVTGGGGGIGSAICQRLAAAGAKVVVTYNSSKDKAREVADSLEGEGHMVFKASTTVSTELATLAAHVKEKYRRLDVLVNNAGVTTPVQHSDLEGLSDEWIDKILQTNVRGSFAAIRACSELLAATYDATGEPSVVVNISSVAAVTGIGSNVAYCASKAALDSMTRSLGRALAPGVRVVSVSPGWVLGEYAKKMDPAYITEQSDATPLKRLASPEDVADTVWAVVSQLTFMTGNAVPVDGGRPLAV